MSENIVTLTDDEQAWFDQLNARTGVLRAQGWIVDTSASRHYRPFSPLDYVMRYTIRIFHEQYGGTEEEPFVEISIAYTDDLRPLVDFAIDMCERIAQHCLSRGA